MAAVQVAFCALALFAFVQLSSTCTVSGGCCPYGTPIDYDDLITSLLLSGYNTGYGCGGDCGGGYGGCYGGCYGGGCGGSCGGCYGGCGAYTGCGCPFTGSSCGCPGSNSCNACCYCDLTSMIDAISTAYGDTNVTEAFDTYKWCNLCKMYNCLCYNDFCNVMSNVSCKDIKNMCEYIGEDNLGCMICCIGAKPFIDLVEYCNSNSNSNFDNAKL